MSICPVILAGGGGTRLWPLSREHYPKQFLPLFSERSLLQETLLRLRGLDRDIPVLNPLIVCNEEHRFLVMEQAAGIEIPLETVLLEPEGRNTAPALTVAAMGVLEKGLDPVLVMMPADHQVADVDRFQTAVRVGHHHARQDMLVTFGIRPQNAETGYGYIQYGEQLEGAASPAAYRVTAFREKPDKSAAEKYLAAGNYLWNSGIFMMKASVWCDTIKRLQPDMHDACHKAHGRGARDDQFYRLHRESFLACRGDSIDYAVMEKLAGEENAKTAVIALDAGWSDVGAWSTVWLQGHKDDADNVKKGDVVLHDCADNLVRSEYRLVAAVGCHHMVIVETADAVLVAAMDRSQDIKKIIEQLKSGEREERLAHRRVYRPWGSYETVDAGDNFQVKRLIVKPGKKLSLQSHRQRAEHWVVVKGTARVTRGDEIFSLKVNESTYIPAGTKHRLENPAVGLLEIIEVQSGTYLGEDDIVRYADDFGRL